MSHEEGDPVHGRLGWPWLSDGFGDAANIYVQVSIWTGWIHLSAAAVSLSRSIDQFPFTGISHPHHRCVVNPSWRALRILSLILPCQRKSACRGNCPLLRTKFEISLVKSRLISSTQNMRYSPFRDELKRVFIVD
jgi:hypothetical protein